MKAAKGAAAAPLLLVNGKYLAQPLTGVQRAAGELLGALDASLQQRPAHWTVQVAVPRGVVAPAWRQLQARPLGPQGLPLHLWEQVLLAQQARRATLLLNLSGSAPWGAAARSVSLLHDAAVFDHPEAYRPAFVAWYRALFRRQARLARGLLTPSAFSRQRLALALKLDPQQLQRLPLGADHLDALPADPGWQARLGRDANAPWPYLLAVASRNPTKNLPRLLQAFQQVAPARPQLRLLLVGGERGQVFEAERLAPHPRVLATGRVSDAELKSLYQQAQALACPSLVEGFGLPPLEALQAGCPVLAARAGSLPEVLGEAAACWVDPLSVDAIAAGLARLLDEPAYAQSLREQGRARAAQLRWADAGERLRSVLEPLLRERAA